MATLGYTATSSHCLRAKNIWLNLQETPIICETQLRGCQSERSYRCTLKENITNWRQLNGASFEANRFSHD